MARMGRDGMRMTWDLIISDIPITWIEKNLDTMSTKYLKKWTGLAKSANTARLFLAKENGGLQLPSMSTTYKSLQCAKSTSLMTSSDAVVRHLVSEKTRRETTARRKKFQPYKQAVEVLQQDPGTNRKALIRGVKNVVKQEDAQTRLEECRSLSVHGQTTRLPDDRAPGIWSEVIQTLQDNHMKFVLNAVTNTLPHNANLHMWGKRTTLHCQLCNERQSLKHVLNHLWCCSQSKEVQRKTWQCPDVLTFICLLPP